MATLIEVHLPHESNGFDLDRCRHCRGNFSGSDFEPSIRMDVFPRSEMAFACPSRKPILVMTGSYREAATCPKPAPES